MIKNLLLLLKFRSWIKEAVKIKNTKGVLAMLDWLKKKLKEPSTWAAVVALAGYVGLNVTEGIIQAVAGVVLAGIVLYEAIRNEKGA